MALITCPECGRPKVSDKAIACPDCGYNISADFNKNKSSLEDKVKENYEGEGSLENNQEKRYHIDNYHQKESVEDKVGKEGCEASDAGENSFKTRMIKRVKYFSLGMLLGTGLLITSFVSFGAYHIYNIRKVYDDLPKTIRSDEYSIEEKKDFLKEYRRGRLGLDVSPEYLVDVCEAINDIDEKNKEIYDKDEKSMGSYNVSMIKKILEDKINQDGIYSMIPYIEEFQKSDYKTYIQFLKAIHWNKRLFNVYDSLYEEWKEDKKNNRKTKIKEIKRIYKN